MGDVRVALDQSGKRGRDANPVVVLEKRPRSGEVLKGVRPRRQGFAGTVCRVIATQSPLAGGSGAFGSRVNSSRKRVVERDRV